MNDYPVYCPACNTEIGISDPWSTSRVVCRTCGIESVLNYDESIDEIGDESYWFYLQPVNMDGDAPA